MSGLSINDALSPALRERLRRVSDKRPVLEAAGAALAGVATRAFRDPALRPAEWPALAPSTLRRKKGGGPLIDSGALFRSLVAQPPSADGVEVGTDREYALYHQFGTRRMPARPFFPVADDRLTPRAERAVAAAAGARINKLLS